LLLMLNQRGTVLYDYAPSPVCEKIQIFTKFSSEYTAVILEDERLTTRHVQIPSMTDTILLVALHLPSKNFWDESDQAAESTIFSDLIKQAEKIVIRGHLKENVRRKFSTSEPIWTTLRHVQQ